MGKIFGEKIAGSKTMRIFAVPINERLFVQNTFINDWGRVNGRKWEEKEYTINTLLFTN